MTTPFSFMSTGTFPSERSAMPTPLANPFAPNHGYVDPARYMQTIQPSGDPFAGVVGGGFNELVAKIPNPFKGFQHPFDQWVKANGLAPNGMATEESQEDEKVSMPVVMMGTTCTAGSIAFRYQSLDSETFELNIVKMGDKEIGVSNHIEVCGNQQMTNALTCSDQLEHLRGNGLLSKAINHAFDPALLPPIVELVEKTKPIGFINREVGYTGGDSYHWKTDGERGFLSDRYPLALVDLLQRGVHKKMPSFVAPSSVQSQNVYIVLVPTRIQNKTVYVTGGRPLWSHYQMTYPYPPGSEPNYWKTDQPFVEIDFGPGTSERDWIEVYQYQVFTCFENRFPPELVAIDYRDEANKRRLQETGIYRLHYPHYWWKFGSLFGCPEFPHTGAPPKHWDMKRASQDADYQHRTLGDGGKHVLNLHVDISIGMSGYGG